MIVAKSASPRTEHECFDFCLCCAWIDRAVIELNVWILCVLRRNNSAILIHYNYIIRNNNHFVDC